MALSGAWTSPCPPHICLFVIFQFHLSPQCMNSLASLSFPSVCHTFIHSGTHNRCLGVILLASPATVTQVGAWVQNIIF